MNNDHHLSLLILLVPLLFVPLSCITSTTDNGRDSCTPLPDGFSEDGLVGTWVARSASQHTSDTLVINSNGTYKQIIQTENMGPLEYEGHWRFEYRKNGTGYLHMHGFRICAANPEDSCEWLNNGKTPWADACEGQWMDPAPSKGEIVLVVHGYAFLSSDEQVPHPISLTLFRGFESSPWSYSFQEP